MERIRLNGLSLAVDERGHGDAVLLLHIAFGQAAVAAARMRR